MERWSANPWMTDDDEVSIEGGGSWNRQGPPASLSSLMPVGLSCLCSRNILLHDRCMPPRYTCTRAHPRLPVTDLLSYLSLFLDVSIRDEKSRKLDRVLFSRPFIQFERKKSMFSSFSPLENVFNTCMY